MISRLSMIGYGQFRPRASNDTPAGRNANRRVVLVILADSGDSGGVIGGVVATGSVITAGEVRMLLGVTDV